MTKVTVRDIVRKFQSFAPESLALGKDPVGLHFGFLDQEIHKVLLTLDVRPEVVQEAIAKDCDMILAHHPPIFKAPKRLTEDDPQQAMYAELIRHGIAVYAAHTNLDAAWGGMNDWLAEAYDIVDTEVLYSYQEDKNYRIKVYLPKENLADYQAAIFGAGYAQVGNYDQVSFTSKGQGHFRPLDQANPSIGSVQEETAVDEVVFSFLVSQSELSAALDLARDLHPYEEAVIDVVSLANKGQVLGIGRVGQLKTPMPFRDYVHLVKERTGVDALRAVVWNWDQEVERVAVLGGSGADEYPYAIAKDADVYITADVSYHTGHDMIANRLNVIDPGHHMESICKDKLAQVLVTWIEEEDWPLAYASSQLNTDPFTFVY
ncbi:Nif3-like dinuclear metal center hexameric protein [Aerococcus sanguinicola]|uniref:GTP cyclohydrolase 1 type 2 homolog n=1 Tax=Aerococcus sanguinicola TaxID=119206 RepID=A0A120I9E6_9LACT|nr:MULTISPECIES: Nif3-like dinuclear metal center hexameric protein [Aerococcus]AMB94703.1 hypothetical protein AWM72_08010 [Aerococcus sanguinicola]MDK7050914.1 Nif3-like dinuclear metal center hexameric protein [Aerococcus sanguinicola]OFT96453.1 hypothetical protein HMPREF3090_02340 [Aerococcus sp. HMSC23C02]